MIAEQEPPSIEEQIKDLLAAGWKQKTIRIWQSPWGALFIGPHGAWKVMRHAPASDGTPRGPDRCAGEPTGGGVGISGAREHRP
jgi:hypothetical protein